jgi:hypothetical protein
MSDHDGLGLVITIVWNAQLVNLRPNNRLDELMPWAWSAARQQQQRAA